MLNNNPRNPQQGLNEVGKPEFKGYTLDELRYQRALHALKCEYSKENVIASINKLRQRSIFGRTKMGLKSKMPSMMSKILSGLSYADYAMMGISIYSSARKVFSLFKKKKK